MAPSHQPSRMKSVLGAFALAMAGLLSAPAAAQNPGEELTIQYGQSVNGRLEGGDQDDLFVYYDVYPFQGRAGDVVEIAMVADGFDTYLSLITPLRARAVEDDDGGDGTNSLIRYTLPADGTYRIEASSYADYDDFYSDYYEIGEYQLTLTRVDGDTAPASVSQPPPAPAATPAATSAAPPPAAAAGQTPIAYGQSFSGTLANDDLITDGTGARYDLYRFSANAGDNIRITMRSLSFDAFLRLFGWAGVAAPPLHVNDDGAGGTDSLLEFVIPASGEYFIQATSFHDTGRGAYTLELARQ